MYIFFFFLIAILLWNLWQSLAAVTSLWLLFDKIHVFLQSRIFNNNSNQGLRILHGGPCWLKGFSLWYESNGKKSWSRRTCWLSGPALPWYWTEGQTDMPFFQQIGHNHVLFTYNINGFSSMISFGQFPKLHEVHWQHVHTAKLENLFWCKSTTSNRKIFFWKENQKDIPRSVSRKGNCTSSFPV